MSQNQYFIDGDNPHQPSNRITYVDATLQRTLMQRVFLWMSIGLGITGLAAYAAFTNGLAYTIASSSGLFYGLIIAELLLVMGLSSMIRRMSFMLATVLFGLYAALNGLTMSYIFLVYTEGSIASTFFISAGMFAAMSAFGYLTKRDLTSWGNLLFMALIGLIIAGVVNMFLGSSTLSLITSAIGVLVFVGLTAYDVQKIKMLFADVYQDDEEIKKVSVLGALSLYLDFINLFLYLLRFLGNRRN